MERGKEKGKRKEINGEKKKGKNEIKTGNKGMLDKEGKKEKGKDEEEMNVEEKERRKRERG